MNFYYLGFKRESNLFMPKFVENLTMKSKIIFTEDHKLASIYIMKVFSAEVTPIWDFFTKPEYLDQWWAPKPWKCETIKMDFQPEGYWRYVMKGPENEKHFGAAQFHEITKNRSFDWTDYFTDEAGNQITTFPAAKWLFGFTGVQEGTKLTANIHFSSPEEMRQILDMGFEEGFKKGLNKLEDLVSTRKKFGDHAF